MNLQHPSQAITPEQCAAELMEAIPVIMQFIRTEMRSQSAALLSVPQFRLLAFLKQCPQSSLSEVAEHLGVTRATASAMTDRLVQRNFVSRIEHPQMRRQVMLTLTEAGMAYLQEVQLITQSKIASLMSHLTEDQLLHVSVGLVTLDKIFKQATL